MVKMTLKTKMNLFQKVACVNFTYIQTRPNLLQNETTLQSIAICGGCDPIWSHIDWPIPILSFNGCTVDVWESNCIRQFIIDVNTYSCWIKS